MNTNFVSCNCPSYKFDSICKHSIAVAQLKGFLEKHLNHVTKKSGPRCTKTALAESNVDKQRAGKNWEAKTKLNIVPPNNKPRKEKFKSKAVKVCAPIYTTMTTLSWCAFFQKKPRNVRHATWTSATGNGMSLLIWYWSTKKGGTFRKRATGTTKCPQTKRENDITIQTYRNV